MNIDNKDGGGRGRGRWDNEGDKFLGGTLPADCRRLQGADNQNLKEVPILSFIIKAKLIDGIRV